MKKKEILIDSFGTIIVETRGVNSDIVTNEVITFATEVLANPLFSDFTEEHDRDTLIQYVEHFFLIMMGNHIIEQFDIIFDKRNNTRVDMNAGKFALKLTFKQKHCLNDTSVKFLIGGKK